MNTHPRLDKILKFRQSLLKQIDGLTNEQINAIPAGFSNNIIWNLGHILAATQGICYRRAGQPVKIEEQYFLPFLTNTAPAENVNSEAAAAIREQLISTLHTLGEDYTRGHFDRYTASENIQAAYGIELRTIDDALDFVLYHDGYHAARITAMKQLV